MDTLVTMRDPLSGSVDVWVLGDPMNKTMTALAQQSEIASAVVSPVLVDVVNMDTALSMGDRADLAGSVEVTPEINTVLAVRGEQMPSLLPVIRSTASLKPISFRSVVPSVSLPVLFPVNKTDNAGWRLDRRVAVAAQTPSGSLLTFSLRIGSKFTQAFLTIGFAWCLIVLAAAAFASVHAKNLVHSVLVNIKLPRSSAGIFRNLVAGNNGCMIGSVAFRHGAILHESVGESDS